MAAEDHQEHNEDFSDPQADTLPLFSQNPDEEDWGGEDLERAYQEALNTIEHVEQQWPTRPTLFEEEELADEEGQTVHSFNDFPSQEIPGKAVAATRVDESASVEPSPTIRIQPAKIVEAALFVGGMPLTVKRLSGVLRDEFDRDYIERVIDDLNLQYDDENRPYEIRLEEGGYRMALRPEYESVRNKSYGFGPKEVRLSQEALEVLALIAYKQPIRKEEIEATGKLNPNSVLRQLLRREIIGLKRTGKTAKEVSYYTTPRFLQIFGLADLGELPRSEDLTFK